MDNEEDSVLQELNKLFNELKQTHEVRSKDSGDSITSDQRIQNENNEQFDSLIKRLDELISNTSQENAFYIKLLSMKASILYEQGKILMSVEDIDGSQKMLENALSLILEHCQHEQVTFLYLRIINHLSYLLSKKGEFEKSKELLESVLDNEEIKNKTTLLVYSTDELFSNEEINQSQATQKVNKLVANNLQMLGWIYGKLGQPDMHAAKQHMALERQLEAGDCDPVDWACRCSRLATLYLAGLHWTSARYHLVAAGVVLDRLESAGLIVHPDLTRAQADLARGWVNYGLHLFSNSKSHLLERKYPGTFNPPVPNEDEPEEVKEIEFPGLIINIEGIPAKPINTTEDARKLFLHTHAWLKRARLYYTLHEFPIHYVNAVLDLSELYRFLAFYEPDLDSQYNVQKRRADALETLSAVLREVRPQCYVAVSVELLRELTEVQIEMMGLNLRRLHMTDNDAVDDEENLNQKITAVSHIQKKLECVGDMLGHTRFEEQESLEDENESTQLNAHEYIESPK